MLLIQFNTYGDHRDYLDYIDLLENLADRWDGGDPTALRFENSERAVEVEI